jgi:hypothetical protein
MGSGLSFHMNQARLNLHVPAAFLVAPAPAAGAEPPAVLPPADAGLADVAGRVDGPKRDFKLKAGAGARAACREPDTADFKTWIVHSDRQSRGENPTPTTSFPLRFAGS